MRVDNFNSLVSSMERVGRFDRFIVFITGATGSGKSTISSNLARRFKIECVKPGQAVRNNPALLQKVIESESTSAPEATESFVREWVVEAMERNKSSIIVDGMPRNISQVNFCAQESHGRGYIPIFVLVNVPLDIRRERLLKRDHKGDNELMERRLRDDEKAMPWVIEKMKAMVNKSKIGFYYEIYHRRSADREFGTQTET